MCLNLIRQPVTCRIYPVRIFDYLSPIISSRMKGVVRITAVARVEDKVYVFCNRPAGGNLDDFLAKRKGKPMHEKKAATMFRQVVEVVAEGHSKGGVLRAVHLQKCVFEDERKYVSVYELFHDVYSYTRLHVGSHSWVPVLLTVSLFF